MQHQFYESLEHYVTNKQLFLRLGGRAVTMNLKGEKIVHRKSLAPSGGGGSGGNRGGNSYDLEDGDGTGGGNGGQSDPLDDTRRAERKRAASKAAAKAKAEALKKKGMDQMLGLSIEEHKARANKRISEHARVQYFESVREHAHHNCYSDIYLMCQSLPFLLLQSSSFPLYRCLREKDTNLSTFTLQPLQLILSNTTCVPVDYSRCC